MGRSMAKRDIVVIGASAGGVEAVTRLISLLPSDFSASIYVVIHIPASRPSSLPSILQKAGRLKARHPKPNEVPRNGIIYVGPPNFHLLLKNEGLVLGRGPRENGHRPAIDPLFRTAVQTYGRRAIGILLSGMLDDGSAGFADIHQGGGITIVQDPREATFPDMPLNATKGVKVDYVLPVAEIARLLPDLVREEIQPEVSAMPPKITDLRSSRAEGIGAATNESGQLSDQNGVYSCPECGGALWELGHGGAVARFECRVGHSYSPDSLRENQEGALEAAFWTVLRNLEESASLNQRLHSRALEAGQLRAAAAYEVDLAMIRRRIALVRQALHEGNLAPVVLSSVGGSEPAKTESAERRI
jgi:two-component system, chemotaxis family, protein-glutamate methylesterase/glutaminase